MATLATIEQLEARVGRTFEGDEVTRAEAVLDDVSATVRAYTGQQFTEATTTARIRARNGGVSLPQRPVTAVSAVDNVDGDAVTFTWDYGESVVIEGLGDRVRFDVEPFRDRLPWVDVIYTHGYENVPEDIVAVVCQIAGRTIGRPADESGITQESIAGYSYSTGAVAGAGPAGMLPDEKRVLDRYRKAIGMIRVAQ